jgi:GNAT superfamily N-acetyltransferase
MADITRIEAFHLNVIESLVNQSAQEGFQFLQRLVDDWAAGRNRFDGKGEGLFVAQVGQQLVGIGGLNRDPYASDERVGRLRHLYILPTHRRQGIGRLLVQHIVAFARPHYQLIRLRTDTAAAASFYTELGFHAANQSDATHVFALAGR